MEFDHLAAVFIPYSRSLTGLLLTLSLILLVKENIKFLIPLRLAIITLFIILFCAAILTSIWVIYPISISHDADAELTTVAFHTSPDMRSILQNAAVKIIENLSLELDKECLPINSKII